MQQDGDGGLEHRVTDVERERAIEMLKAQTAAGRLTLEEFSERAELAWTAKTRGDLEELTRDLPTESIDPVSRQLPATRWTVAVMGSANRRGRWRVAPLTNVVAMMGSCRLDLRTAEFSGEDITINVATVMGSVDILVPEGIEVEISGIPVMGSKDLRLRDVPRVAGSPRVRVRALAVMGSVAVRSKPSNRGG